MGAAIQWNPSEPAPDPSPVEARKKWRWSERMGILALSFPFLILPCIMIVKTLGQAWEHGKTLNFAPTTGRITHLSLGGGRGMGMHASGPSCHVEYDYEVDGRLLKGATLKYGSEVEANFAYSLFRQGQAATVYYDPLQPERSTLIRGEWSYEAIVLTLMVPLSLGPVFLLGYVFSRLSRREKIPETSLEIREEPEKIIVQTESAFNRFSIHVVKANALFAAPLLVVQAVIAIRMTSISDSYPMIPVLILAWVALPYRLIQDFRSGPAKASSLIVFPRLRKLRLPEKTDLISFDEIERITITKGSLINEFNCILSIKDLSAREVCKLNGANEARAFATWLRVKIG